jgi:UDP-N-acetylglucosamine 4,6-dehydratase
MSKNILITGITGFLGRNLVKYIKDKQISCKIFGIGNSEKKIVLFKKTYPDVKVYKHNITDPDFQRELEVILLRDKIDYVIHSAAMKYVDICEMNPIETIKTNVYASKIIIDVCTQHKVKNMISLSTDKSNTPFNVYGMSKNIMERMTLANGYTVYQGANFFGSDGSVIDIWFNQKCNNQPLTVTDLNHIRYFNDIGHICEKIINGLDTKLIILPDYVYKIQLSTLLNAFKTKFNYDKIQIVGKTCFEKTIEELDPTITDIRELDVDATIKLLDEYFSGNNLIIEKI